MPDINFPGEGLKEVSRYNKMFMGLTNGKDMPDFKRYPGHK